MSINNHCIETISDVVAVYPIPASTLNYAIPFNIAAKSISPVQMGLASMDALVAFLFGTERFALSADYIDDASGALHGMDEQPAAKSTGQKTIAAYIYNVSVPIKITHPTVYNQQFAHSLAVQPHDVVLELADGSYLLARCADNGYKCSIDESITDTHTLTLTIDINNINGLQIIQS